MNDEDQESERIRKIVMEAELMQAKRTMKALTFLTIVFFAVEGVLAIYHFFF